MPETKNPATSSGSGNPPKAAKKSEGTPQKTGGTTSNWTPRGDTEEEIEKEKEKIDEATREDKNRLKGKWTAHYADKDRQRQEREDIDEVLWKGNERLKPKSESESKS